MTILSDKWIKNMLKRHDKTFGIYIHIERGKISFGLSSYGYDARVSNEFKFFRDNVNSGIVDPKVFKKLLLPKSK